MKRIFLPPLLHRGPAAAPRWLFSLGLAIVYGAAAFAGQWPLQDIHFETADSRAGPYYLYVPAHQRFVDVHLRAQIQAAGETNVLRVYVDGELRKVAGPGLGRQLDLSLPELGAGFHRLEFAGWPTTRTVEHQLDVRCGQVYSLPFSLTQLQLEYRAFPVRTPWISELPDGLYNRSQPRQEPYVGIVRLLPQSPDAAEAALRIASGLQANAGIRWLIQQEAQMPTADFLLSLVQQPGLSSPAQIELNTQSDDSAFVDSLRLSTRLFDEARSERPERQIPTLTVRYRDAEGLRQAVHALLDPVFRKQLRSATASVRQPVEEPVWATLAQPLRLSDFGVTDGVLTGDGARTLVLPLPVHWQPTGPVTGRLRLRSQAGLPANAHLNAWLDQELAGSIPLAFLGSGDLQRELPLQGVSTPSGSALILKLDTALNPETDCRQQAPGQAWLDPVDSRVEIPHRDKQGVVQLLPALVGKPRLTTDGSAAALSAALAIAESLQRITSGGPLPLTLDVSRDASAVVRIAVDAGAFTEFVQKNADRVDPDWASRSILLQASADGHFTVLAERPDVLSAFGAVWPKMLERIPDGALDVLIDPVAEELLVVDRTFKSQLSPGQSVSRHALAGWMIVVGMIAAVFSGVLIWTTVYRKKRP